MLSHELHHCCGHLAWAGSVLCGSRLLDPSYVILAQLVLTFACPGYLERVSYCAHNQLCLVVPIDGNLADFARDLRSPDRRNLDS